MPEKNTGKVFSEAKISMNGNPYTGPKKKKKKNEIKFFCHFPWALKLVWQVVMLLLKKQYNILWKTAPIFQTFFPIMADILNLKNSPLKVTSLPNY